MCSNIRTHFIRIRNAKKPTQRIVETYIRTKSNTYVILKLDNHLMLSFMIKNLTLSTVV